MAVTKTAKVFCISSDIPYVTMYKATGGFAFCKNQSRIIGESGEQVNAYRGGTIVADGHLTCRRSPRMPRLRSMACPFRADHQPWRWRSRGGWNDLKTAGGSTLVKRKLESGNTLAGSAKPKMLKEHPGQVDSNLEHKKGEIIYVYRSNSDKHA